MRLKLLLTTILTLCCMVLFAQGKRVIKGCVVGENKEPIVGVSVVVKNTNIGTTTDIDGNYSIKVDDSTSPALVFDYLGMTRREVKVNNKGIIDITLTESVQQMEEVMVIGYGTVRRKEMTGAAVQVDADKLNNNISSDLGSALQGVVPGVSISASSGDPGAWLTSKFVV